MSSFPDAKRLAVAGLLLWGAGALAQSSTPFPGIGRPATAKEIRAWDIDVRPDFKGLPKGSGTVARGQEVWEAKCSSCHGVFGESNEVFNPIVGGTTKEDMRSGKVARLDDPAYPGRTTLMKLSSISTLWDYINRAMPWAAPKTLSVEEVYAVTAYILNLGGILPENFTLSDQNMAEVQKLLPNRNGMTTDHALWPGGGMGGQRPDVQAKACMTGCANDAKVASFLPDFARNAHGNLAEQNRLVGAQVGADTTRPAPPSSLPSGRPQVEALAAAGAKPPAPASPAKPPADGSATAALALIQKHTCNACHGLDARIVGPGFVEVANRYSGRPDALAYLSGKIKLGSSGAWGAIPMPPQALSEAEARAIARWLAEGARR